MKWKDIKKLKTMTDVIAWCVWSSGLTEKQVYMGLGLTSANWSRIMNGTAYFPHDKLSDLQRICRSDLIARWLLAKFLEPHEEEVKNLQEEIKILKERNQYLESFIKKI